MTVRLAQPSDLERLVELEQICEGDDSWSENLIRDGLAGTVPTVTWLVDEGGRGYAVVSVAGDIAELQRIGVHPEHRRQGIAHILLARCLDVGADQGAERMLLEVRADNRPALDLYAARGFTEIDRRARYYSDGATAVVMGVPLMKVGA